VSSGEDFLLVYALITIPALLLGIGVVLCQIRSALKDIAAKGGKRG
jgi:hypothetical protein